MTLKVGDHVIYTYYNVQQQPHKGIVCRVILNKVYILWYTHDGIQFNTEQSYSYPLPMEIIKICQPLK